MSESKFLIHIKDILQNKHFVYNTQVVTQENHGDIFKQCFNDLKSKTEIDLKYTISNNYCEIYSESEIINKGWVWSSSTIKKEILYLLTLIPIYSFQEKEEKCTNTQTLVEQIQSTIIPLITRTCDTQTIDLTKTQNKNNYIRENNYNDYNDKIYDIFYKVPEYTTQEYKMPEYKMPEYKVPEYKAQEYKAPEYTTTDPYYQPASSSTQFNNPFNNPFNTQFNNPFNNSFNNNSFNDPFSNSFSNGYAKNPFVPVWGDSFSTELKKKLSIPNFGLRSTINF